MVGDAVIATLTVTAITTYLGVRYLASSESSRRVKACSDAYTLSSPSWERNDNFVKCMQGQFPDDFVASYKKKLESDSKLNDTE